MIAPIHENLVTLDALSKKDLKILHVIVQIKILESILESWKSFGEDVKRIGEQSKANHERLALKHLEREGTYRSSQLKLILSRHFQSKV